jgi:hypothetical protein
LRSGVLVALDLPDFTVHSMDLALLRRTRPAPGPVATALFAALRDTAATRDDA